MSKKKKRSDEAPMPASSAGILTFYQEKTQSIAKIRPELVIASATILIITIILATMFFPR